MRFVVRIQGLWIVVLLGLILSLTVPTDLRDGADGGGSPLLLASEEKDAEPESSPEPEIAAEPEASVEPEMATEPEMVPPTPPEAAPASTSAHRLLITGDSITQGSAGDYTWRYRLWRKLADSGAGVTFVGTTTALYDLVRDRYDSQSYLVNFSGNAHSARWGTSYIDQVSQIGSQVSSTNPTILVVALGFNDLSFATSPAQTIENVRQYVLNARAAAPGIDIVITEVTTGWNPWTGEINLGPQTAEFATRLQALRTELDTPSERIEIANTLTGWDPRVHTWDAAHPNPTGETVIAQRVSEALARLGVGSASPSIIANTSWGAQGPQPGATWGQEVSEVSWSRISTGATGMFLHHRIPSISSVWQKLPYAVATPDGWTMTPLLAGANHDFAVSPVKGSSEGIRGPHRRVWIAAEPFQQAVPSITGQLNNNANGVDAAWNLASNAGGYLMGHSTMAHGETYTELPYPVSASTSGWNIQPLYSGRYYQVTVTPVRGLVKGNRKNSSNVRLPGNVGGRIYVAIGDSYSSGLGAHDDWTNYNLHRECRRTTSAWPYMMQPAWNTATRLLACQGDTLDDGIEGGVRSQMARIPPILAQYPLAHQLITVTVGGNDVDFTGKLRTCVVESTPCSSLELSWSAEIEAMDEKLVEFYDDLRDVAPNADIIVGGYPGVVQFGGESSNILCSYISMSERATINRLSSLLNDVIHDAAEYTQRGGVNKSVVWSAAPRVSSEFAGHNACATSDEWIHAGTTGGGQGWGVVGFNSFHPNPNGQYGYALAFSNTLIARTS